MCSRHSLRSGSPARAEGQAVRSRSLTPENPLRTFTRIVSARLLSPRPIRSALSYPYGMVTASA
jgi:hypothetical protein